jgi:hypothetical protein
VDYPYLDQLLTSKLSQQLLEKKFEWMVSHSRFCFTIGRPPTMASLQSCTSLC